MALQRRRTARHAEKGFSLIEVMVATMVFLVGATSLLGLITTAALTNAGHGVQGTRATEYAVAKMEQLMALQFGDVTSDTRGMQPVSSGGTGLGGTVAGTTYPSGGNLTAGTCANASYCDYIIQGSNGDSVSTSSTGANYMRQWQIVMSNDAAGNPNVATITVMVTSLGVITRVAPSTTLVSQKTNFSPGLN